MCNLAKHKEEEEKIVMSIPFVMTHGFASSLTDTASTRLQVY